MATAWCVRMDESTILDQYSPLLEAMLAGLGGGGGEYYNLQVKTGVNECDVCMSSFKPGEVSESRHFLLALFPLSLSSHVESVRF